MQAVSVGQSFWIYTLLFTFLQLWGRLSASTSSPTLTSPTLDIYLRSKSSVVLVCRAPDGQRGVKFMLYRNEKEVDSQVLESEQGRFSAFSPYLHLEKTRDTASPRYMPSPVLSVNPSTSQPQASLVSNHDPQPGVFTVGPVTGGEEGEYTCIYQVNSRRGLVNSTVSNTVLISITDALPVPTLVLEQQTGCVAFALHRLCCATFPVPVQETPVAFYQCQYNVLLAGKWSNSPRSLPLAVTRGIPPPSSTDFSTVDWPLVLGSFSAVVLFLCSVILVVVVARRQIKAAAEEKKRREEAHFWTQVHAKDHVVDLTLRRTSITQEWASVDSPTETASRSPLWTSLSTFTTPIHPYH
ncbi:hypothetical protein KUCAC02_015694 [Chaenocephalus aceratus]|uniref:Uncharacterized protein n=1 Tax=Chaenocephalus aceratus TaxID=36190 RepID=A0ACB9Y0Q4_CHAAC|nr:hypothetical protein KUCAC02_015694 [Chaenocephalus aceratus]